MSDPATELAREWLAGAGSDLRVADFLLTMPDPPPQVIGFHAQQCAEKALKGYLTARQVRFERRHDLSYLLDLCAPSEPGFEQFRAEADELTPYAVEFRYPETPATVPMESAQSAVATARRMHEFVLTKLSPVA
jgi:HEPN domain-containing protein